MQSNIPETTESQTTRIEPRARAIVEFVEGDLNRSPVIFPDGGSDELDNAICEAIRRRWKKR